MCMMITLRPSLHGSVCLSLRLQGELNRLGAEEKRRIKVTQELKRRHQREMPGCLPSATATTAPHLVSAHYQFAATAPLEVVRATQIAS